MGGACCSHDGAERPQTPSTTRPHPLSDWIAKALPLLGSRGKAPATFSYNIAVAQSRAGQPDAALETARSLRAELARRGASSFPELDLVEATALYRTGKKAQADAVAARVQTSGDADAASRASFLRGLIADDTGDVQPRVRWPSLRGPLSAPATRPGPAGLYLRAGRSATAQGDAANARLWLHEAMASSTDPTLLRAAQQVFGGYRWYSL